MKRCYAVLAGWIFLIGVPSRPFPSGATKGPPEFADVYPVTPVQIPQGGLTFPTEDACTKALSTWVSSYFGQEAQGCYEVK